MRVRREENMVDSLVKLMVVGVVLIWWGLWERWG